MSVGAPQAILFDLDGTLIDSAPDLGAAVDEMRVARGLPSLPLEHYRHMAGAGARGMLGLAFDMAPDHPQFNEYKEEFFRHYESRLTQLTKAFDGVAEMLLALQQRGLPWGIVTNKSRRFTDPLVQQMALLSPAAVVISGDTTPHAKPHPEPLLASLKQIDDEHKRPTRQAMATRSAIRHVRRADQFPPTTHPHARDTDLPCFDQLSEAERNGLPTIP